MKAQGGSDRNCLINQAFKISFSALFFIIILVWMCFESRQKKATNKLFQTTCAIQDEKAILFNQNSSIILILCSQSIKIISLPYIHTAVLAFPNPLSGMRRWTVQIMILFKRNVHCWVILIFCRFGTEKSPTELSTSHQNAINIQCTVHKVTARVLQEPHSILVDRVF